MKFNLKYRANNIIINYRFESIDWIKASAFALAYLYDEVYFKFLEWYKLERE